MSTCAIISGVTATLTRGGERSALGPGRRRVARLGLGQLVRPHRDLLLALPLEGHHLVSQLEAVLIDLVVAEDRLGLELEELLADPGGVAPLWPPHRLSVDETAGVPGRRVIRRLVAEVLLVGLEELLVAGVRQGRLPLRGAVDVLRVLLE